MKRFVAIAILLVVIFSSFKWIDDFAALYPIYWPKPTYDFTKNQFSKEKVELGRKLFYDPIFSKNNKISCASCHSPYSSFAHIDHALSHGIDDSIGTRNAPVLINLAWQKYFMWDGSILNLDKQALTPISHPKEMGESMNHVITKLQQSNIYPTLFSKIYGDGLIKEDRVLKCITQFLLSLISCNSKYDSVMNLTTSFTKQEQNGYTLFKRNCAACHKEPFFTSNNFSKNELAINSSLMDFGRMNFTDDRKDSMLFKVPTLRNIEYSYPYMHDGRFAKLGDVLNHYASIKPSVHNAKELQKGMKLSSNEKIDIIAFLLTLSDRKFIFNEDHLYPK